MEHNKYSSLLDLLLALTQWRGATTEELMNVTKTSRRNLYYCFEALRNYGFTVVRQGRRYHLDSRSPFFCQLAGNVNFSETEALYLHKLVSAGERTQLTEDILRKLEQFYNLNVFTDPDIQSRMTKNVARLYEAMDKKKLVMLKNYSSPHSRTVSNRIVEPFLFLNNDIDVQCYELLSGRNKTFKVSRMESVIVCNDLNWSHEYMHKKAYTDLFMFTGDERHHIRLRLGQLSSSVLLEERPMASKNLRQEDERHWILDTDVVSYVGVGRFVLGLAADIEVLDDEGLRQYLRQQVANMKF